MQPNTKLKPNFVFGGVVRDSDADQWGNFSYGLLIKTKKGTDVNTLLKKIEGIFKHKSIYFLDALVGYFRASGYFQIREFIERAQEIRILVGINIDSLIYEANQQGILYDGDAEKAQEAFFQEIKKNIQRAEYSKTVEDGMIQFIKDIITGKVKIKIHPKQNIHAKIYIFKEK